MAEKGKRMRWREVLSKRTIILLVIILGLVAVGIAFLFIKPSSQSLHPEQCRVDVVAWWDYNPHEPEKSLYMNLTFVELDVNGTYCFSEVWLNPQTGTLEGKGSITHGCAWYEGQIEKGISEGDTLHARSDELYTGFQLRNGNRVDVVLPFYILEKVEYDGTMYDRKQVGQLEFSVEVQGETPPEYR